MHDLYVWCADIDECLEGRHSCVNASDCVDTDGGHYCPSNTTNTPMEPTTEITTVTMEPTIDTTTIEPTTETTGLISTINTEIMSSTASTMVTPSSTTSLSATTVYGNQYSSHIRQIFLYLPF